MRSLSKQLYVCFLALGASFLLDACHSGKNATKSSSTTRTRETTYTPTKEGSHGNDNANPGKNLPANNEPTPKKNTIASTYAEKLGVSKSDITNYQLYSFIDAWYGTPYKYAGRTKSGVDCSDFVSLLLQNVYNLPVSGAVTDLYRQCKPIKPSQLREGDLVFFKINKKSLSHVGVYLQNNKFVHASVHSGVVIDDLGEDYYKKYFRASGRVLR